MSGHLDYLKRLFPKVLLPQNLGLPAASAMARLLASGTYGGASLVECRGTEKDPDCCFLLVEIFVALGQKAIVTDIRHVELVGIEYHWVDRIPLVRPLREDFPAGLPHLNLAIKGFPTSLCLFDMPEEEAVRLVTPMVLLERVRAWLSDTAYGRLHQDDQPLEPLFMNAGRSVILPRTEDEADLRSAVLKASVRSDERLAPIFLETAEPSKGAQTNYILGFTSLLLMTRPLPNGQLSVLPMTVAELVGVYRELGADILPDLQQMFDEWTRRGDVKDLATRQCVLIVGTPVERSPGQIDGYAWKAFLTEVDARTLASALNSVAIIDGIVGKILNPEPVNQATLEGIRLEPLDVIRPFDRKQALMASGVSDGGTTPLKVTLVGAGALGSQLALDAARSGIGDWTVVDTDFLMPHNLARHAFGSAFLGGGKAQALAWEISEMLGSKAAKFSPERIQTAPSEALADANLIIDASASVPTSRWLAGFSGDNCRIASVFLNPAGSDLVIMIEGLERKPRLDHLEMAYYWALANDSRIADHLATGGSTFLPSGGCRRPSLQIPQYRVAALAAIGAKRLLLDGQGPDGLIEMWRMSDDGIQRTVLEHIHFREVRLGDWTIAIARNLLRSVVAARRSAGALETGGILVGTWDRTLRKAYIVGHYGPPPDSVCEPTCFLRGESGVFMTLDAVEHRTARNLTYCGEWHTHPPGFGNRPSADDKVLLRWIDDLLTYADVPALMLIVGESGVRLMLGRSNVSIEVLI